MKDHEHLYIQLNRCTLFSLLSVEELEMVVTFGNVQNLETNSSHEFGSKSLGFLNVVLDGSVRVRRIDASLDEEVLEQHEGSAFGTIDNVMGFGRFTSVFAEKESQIFSMHRDSLWALLEELPRLKEHLSSIRSHLAIKASVVQKGDRSAREAREKDGAGSFGFRLAPRFSVWEHRVHVQLADGETKKVENVSFKGFWAIGAYDGPVDSKISFLLRATSLDYPALELSGTVVHKTGNGFAVNVQALPEQLLKLWEGLVLKAMSLELVEAPDHKVSHLRTPLAASVMTEEGEIKGELVSIGPEGAVFQAMASIPPKGLVVDLSMPEGGDKVRHLQLDAMVLGGRSNDYLLGFQRVDSEIRELILSHLERDAVYSAPIESEDKLDVPTTSPETTEEEAPAPEVEPPPPPELIRLPDLEALRNLYYTDLRNRILHLQARPHFRLDQVLHVRFHLPLGIKRLVGIDNLPAFEGTIFRLMGPLALLRLQESEERKIQTVKNILDRCGVADFERDLKSNTAVEHNTEHRRYVQLILVVLLFLSCLVWLYFKISR